MADHERVVMVLSGGIGLGAYQAGAYAALHEEPERHPGWLAGSSVGAVNAALLAGNPPEQRIRALRQFWTTDDPPFFVAQSLWSPWPHLHNWMSALRGRLFGVHGHFAPRIPVAGHPFKSLYDLAPMCARLRELVDFDRLNGGSVRLTVAATDVESGEPVLFDTARGIRIGPDHLLASCGFLPEFAPVEIGGRLLGDGGLSANAPIEPVLLDGDTEGRLVCFVVDLFARDGARPKSLEEALARKSDLLFGNQTHQRLEALGRESELRGRMARLASYIPRELRKRADVAALVDDVHPQAVHILHLSYRAPPEEAGPERPFDLSPSSVRSRWRAGALDMAEALRVLARVRRREAGLDVWTIRRAGGDKDVRPAAA